MSDSEAKNIRRGQRQFRKARQQAAAARQQVRTWGERRGEAWVVLTGSETESWVVATFATKAEMLKALEG